MNKNFVSKFIALVMLGYCCSIANTMDSDDSRSINSTEGKTSFIGSVWSVNNMDNGPRVEYEPDKMWFDYQALFDKTKSVVLEQNIDIEVKHTDFHHDDLARNATGIKDNNSRILKEALSGDIDTQSKILENIIDYYANNPGRALYFDGSICDCNYFSLLGIVSSLCNLQDTYGFRKQCKEYIGYLPNVLSERNVAKVKYYDIMKLLSGMILH